MSAIPQPRHPDLWLLSKATNELQASNSSTELAESITAQVHMQSLVYITEQRCILATDNPDVFGEQSGSMLGAIFIDGFLTGTRYKDLKAAQRTDPVTRMREFLNSDIPEEIKRDGVAEEYGYRQALADMLDVLGNT